MLLSHEALEMKLDVEQPIKNGHPQTRVAVSRSFKPEGYCLSSILESCLSLILGIASRVLFGETALTLAFDPCV